MKNKYIAAWFAILFWWLGFHKFYLWKWVQWILYIILCVMTFWVLPWLIGILEWLVYLLNSKNWFDNNYNFDYMYREELLKRSKNNL